MGKPSNYKRKRKRGHIAGKKPPAFTLTLRSIAVDSLLRKDELEKHAESMGDEFKEKTDDLGRLIMNPNNLPENTIVVDTLYGHQLYSEERLANHFDTLVVACQEFSEEFWLDERGASICDLRRDRKNRTWGDDQALLQFVYACIAAGLAEWSYPRSEWRNLPAGMPYIKFKGPMRNEIEEQTKGANNEQEQNYTQH